MTKEHKHVTILGQMMIGIICASGMKGFCLSYASGSQIPSWVGQFVNLFDMGLTACFVMGLHHLLVGRRTTCLL